MKVAHKLIIGMMLVVTMPLFASSTDVADLWYNSASQYGTGTGAAKYDLSLYFLSQLFGSAGGILSGGSVPTYLQTILYYFNVGLMLFAGGVISTSVVLFALNTAREGRMMSQGGGPGSFLLRTVGAIGLLSPMPGLGYVSAIQCLVLWTVVQGVSVANFAWNAAQDMLDSQGSLYSPVMATVVDNDSDNATLINTTLNDEALSFAVEVLQAQLLYHSAKQREANDAAENDLVTSNSTDTHTATYTLHGPTGVSGDTWEFGGVEYDFSDSSVNLAQNISMRLSSDYPSGYTTSSSEVKTNWRNSQYVAFSTLFQSMDQLAQTLLAAELNAQTNGSGSLSCDSTTIGTGSTSSCAGLYDLLAATRTYQVAMETLTNTYVANAQSSDDGSQFEWSDEYYITDPEQMLDTNYMTSNIITTATSAINAASGSSSYRTDVSAGYFPAVWSAFTTMMDNNGSVDLDLLNEPSATPASRIAYTYKINTVNAMQIYCNVLGWASCGQSYDYAWFVLGMPTQKLLTVSEDNFNTAMTAWAEAIVTHADVGLDEVGTVVKNNVTATLSQLAAGYNAATSDTDVLDSTSLGQGGWITAGGLFNRFLPTSSSLANGTTVTYPSMPVDTSVSDKYLIDGFGDLISYTGYLKTAVNDTVSATGSTYNNLQNGAYLYTEQDLTTDDYNRMDHGYEETLGGSTKIIGGNQAYLEVLNGDNNQTFSVARTLMVYYMRLAMLSLMPSNTDVSVMNDFGALTAMTTSQNSRTETMQQAFNCAGTFGAGWVGSTGDGGTCTTSGTTFADVLGYAWGGDSDDGSLLGSVYTWNTSGGFACNALDSGDSTSELAGYTCSSDNGTVNDSYGLESGTTAYENSGGTSSAGDVSTQAFIDSDIQVFMFQILKTWIKHVGLNPAPVNPMHALSTMGFDLISAGYNFIFHVVQDVWYVNMSLRLTSYMGNIMGVLLSSVVFSAADAANTVGDEQIDLGNPVSLALGWTMKGLAAVAMGWASGMTANAQYYEIAYPAKLFAATMNVPIALFAGIPMIMLGVMFAFYLPLLPFLVFTFTAIGWFLTVIEAVLAAPLIALGVASPTGHDLLGQSEKVMMLLVSVFIRPASILIGFILAIVLSYGAFAMLNFLLTNVLSTYFLQQLVLPNDALSYVNYMIVFMFVFFYGVILLEMIDQIFSMTYRLPNYLGRWVGTPRDETGEESALSSVRDKVKSSIDGLVSSAGGSVDKVSSRQG